MLIVVQRSPRLAGRHTTEVAFELLTQLAQVRFSAFPNFFNISLSIEHKNLMLQRINDSALLREWTVQKLNSCLNPSTTSKWQASTTKKAQGPRNDPSSVGKV